MYEGELTDEQLAVIAVSNDLPLPPGWWCLSGETVIRILYEERKRRLEARNKVEALPGVQEAEPRPPIDMVLGFEG